MKDLIILGPEQISNTIETLHDKGYEVWCIGSDPRDNADKYFDWNNCKISGRNTLTDYPAVLMSCEDIPLNNPISNMLYIAYKLGYHDIMIFGCAIREDPEVRTAIGMAVAYLRGKGLEIMWLDEPMNTHYGHKK